MKLNKIFNYILTLLPLLECLVALPFLPDTVPMHFDINMQVDRWGSKYELLIIPALCIASLPLMKIMSEKAIKQEKDGKNNEKIFGLLTNLTLLIFNAINAYLLFLAFKSAEGVTLNADCLGKIIFGIMGILFIIMGNVMPKTKMNSYIGLRTKWSRKNEETWKMCQHFCGISMITAGLIIIGVSIFTSGAVCIFISTGVVLTVAALDVLYSYLISKRY